MSVRDSSTRLREPMQVLQDNVRTLRSIRCPYFDITRKRFLSRDHFSPRVCLTVNVRSTTAQKGEQITPPGHPP